MKVVENARIRTVCTRVQIALSAILAACLWATAPAGAQFGLSNPSVAFNDAEGNPETAAGSHPYEQAISFDVNTVESGKSDGAIRDLRIVAPPGLVGDREVVPRCETIEFLTAQSGRSSCPDATAVGMLTAAFFDIAKGEERVPLYNLRPSPGVAAKLGFWIAGVPITVNLGAKPTPPYNITGSLLNTSQVLDVVSSQTILWGNPSDARHDADRGLCAYENVAGECPADLPPRPFLTLPRSCSGSLVTLFEATSWWTGDPLEPGPPAEDIASATSPGMSECSALRFAPAFAARATTDRAESPTGMDVELDIADEGIGDPDGIAGSDIHKAVIALPEGVTANPSLAEGLATCSPQQLARETAASEPGEGCPQASKVGTVRAETPILEGEILEGELFVATQDDPATPQPGAENPFDTLLALYMVIKDRELGVVFRLPGKVEPDPRSGRLVATFDDLPPYPVSHFRAHLREGGRSPLISPPTCGTYTTEALLTPSGDPSHPLSRTSSFQIARGVGGGPCPPAGPPPFAPGFEAGTLNPAAAQHSPLLIRLTRRDGDQDLTRFDATLPPGLTARFADVAQCPDAAIAIAKEKTGRAELASPSCPAGSQIGTVIGGAGVGSQLTYVPGKLYLAGPVRRAPLSVVGVVPAVAGPFDVGTVVVRQALRVDPKSGVGSVDGAASDPIPHILAGIPLRVRDIRVNVDRPRFTLNPTSCDPFAVRALIWGGGMDPFAAGDDAPVGRDARFQAADCARLGFRPRLTIALRGGVRRGGHPVLEGTYRPRPGDANVSDLITRLPRSAFLDQAHIRTICTRVQFAADACPAAAVYGHATVFTPLFAEPLTGPVYLRSSSHDLPDLVLDLHGLVDIEVAARIDSIKGGIRASFEDAPDAPLTKVVLDMQGGRKGLIVNSRNLCASPSRAAVRATAHNAKRLLLHPAVRPLGCPKGRGAGRPRHRG